MHSDGRVAESIADVDIDKGEAGVLVEVSRWKACRPTYERLGLVFDRFKRANTSPTDRADCSANGAYTALDSLWNELRLFAQLNEFPSAVERRGIPQTRNTGHGMSPGQYHLLRTKKYKSALPQLIEKTLFIAVDCVRKTAISVLQM